MQFSLHHDERDAYEGTFASVFRGIFDLAEPTSAYFGLDVELDQSWLYGKRPVSMGLAHIWEHGRYFRLPTWEKADEIRFKLKETEESTFLYPEKVQQRPEKPKGGCPFGYG